MLRRLLRIPRVCALYFALRSRLMRLMIALKEQNRRKISSLRVQFANISVPEVLESTSRVARKQEKLNATRTLYFQQNISTRIILHCITWKIVSIWIIFLDDLTIRIILSNYHPIIRESAYMDHPDNPDLDIKSSRL